MTAQDEDSPDSQEATVRGDAAGWPEPQQQPQEPLDARGVRGVRFEAYSDAEGGYEASPYGYGADTEAHGDVEGGYGATAGYDATGA